MAAIVTTAHPTFQDVKSFFMGPQSHLASKYEEPKRTIISWLIGLSFASFIWQIVTLCTVCASFLLIGIGYVVGAVYAISGLYQPYISVMHYLWLSVDGLLILITWIRSSYVGCLNVWAAVDMSLLTLIFVGHLVFTYRLKQLSVAGK
jgi:hypothetical protein